MCVNLRERKPQLVVLIRCSASLFSLHASVGGEEQERRTQNEFLCSWERHLTQYSCRKNDATVLAFFSLRFSSQNLPLDAHSQIWRKPEMSPRLPLLYTFLKEVIWERDVTSKQGGDTSEACWRKKILSERNPSAGLTFRDYCVWAWGNKSAKTAIISPGVQGRLRP